MNCPCGGLIEKDDDYFECTDCGLRVKNKILGRKIDEEIVKYLFEGKVVYVYGFKSKKTKKIFGAGISLLEDGSVKFIFDDMEWDIVDRCSCDGIIVETDKAFYCRDCGKAVWKEISGKKINKKIAIRLFAGERVYLKGFKSRENKPFEATLYINDEGKVAFDFSNSSNGKPLFKCFCGGDVIEGNKLYYCKSCDLKIWKTFLNKKITSKQVQTLLDGKTISLKNLKSKTGKEFNAKVVYDQSENRLKIVDFF